jgi:hypothetical protein
VGLFLLTLIHRIYNNWGKLTVLDWKDYYIDFQHYSSESRSRELIIERQANEKGYFTVVRFSFSYVKQLSELFILSPTPDSVGLFYSNPFSFWRFGLSINFNRFTVNIARKIRWLSITNVSSVNRPTGTLALLT